MKTRIPHILATIILFYAESGAQNVPAAKLNKQRIELQKEGRSSKDVERFKRQQEVAGFVRHMPNKIIRDAELNKNEGYLVNSRNQKWPVFFTDQELNAQNPAAASNFYLGYFYDLQDKTTKHVYLKTPSL